MTTPLATAQRELARLLRAPDGVRTALAEEGDPTGASLERIVRGDARAAAITRVEIYANAYFFRIRDALAVEFGTLSAALGEAAFHDLATAYLLAHPSTRPSLRWAGAELAGFLAGHPGAEPFRRRWPFAPDLARLEWALSIAFDAPDAKPLARGDLARIGPDRFADLVLALHPSASVLGLDWPVHTLWSDVEGGASVAERAAALQREPVTLLVWRGDGTPRQRPVDADEAALVRALEAGETFGDLCARAAERVGADDAAARVAALLSVWVESEVLGPLPAGDRRLG